MSVFYDLYETPDLAESGEQQPLHARVVLKGSYTAKEFIERVATMQHIPHAQVVGTLSAVVNELKDLLLNGYSVEVGDLGYFSLSLSVDKETLEQHDLRAPSVSLKNINIRVNRQLKRDIATEICLQRHRSPFRVEHPLEEAACLQKLTNYLDTYPCINRSDYARLVGKTKKQALQDIHTFIERGILKKYGTGRSVVYIKA